MIDQEQNGMNMNTQRNLNLFNSTQSCINMYAMSNSPLVPCQASSTSPLNTARWPCICNNIVMPNMDSYNALDHFAIQNTIARYAIALDSKNFDLLDEVFTEDVDTIYPFKGEIKGAQNVADAIRDRFE